MYTNTSFLSPTLQFLSGLLKLISVMNENKTLCCVHLLISVFDSLEKLPPPPKGSIDPLYTISTGWEQMFLELCLR